MYKVWPSGLSFNNRNIHKTKQGIKAKFRHKLIPGSLLTLLLTYSVYNRLLESPCYIKHAISTILVRLVGYGLSQLTGKIAKPRAEQFSTCSQLIIS